MNIILIAKNVETTSHNNAKKTLNMEEITVQAEQANRQKASSVEKIY